MFFSFSSFSPMLLLFMDWIWLKGWGEESEKEREGEKIKASNCELLKDSFTSNQVIDDYDDEERMELVIGMKMVFMKEGGKGWNNNSRHENATRVMSEMSVSLFHLCFLFIRGNIKLFICHTKRKSLLLFSLQSSVEEGCTSPFHDISFA